jgi:hypothetical protein
MTKWNTDEIKELIREIAPGVRIHNSGPGGDVDTDNLVIYFNGIPGRLHLCGFITDGDISNSSDTDVEMIELTDGCDSRGGLSSDNEKLGACYLKIRSELRKKGFQVVPCLKDYF